MARSKAKTPKKNTQANKTTPKNKTPARLNLPTIKFQNKHSENDLKKVKLGKLDVGFACIPGTKPNDGMELFRAQLPGEDTQILIQSLYQVSFVRGLFKKVIIFFQKLNLLTPSCSRCCFVSTFGIHCDFRGGNVKFMRKCNAVP